LVKTKTKKTVSESNKNEVSRPVAFEETPLKFVKDGNQFHLESDKQRFNKFSDLTGTKDTEVGVHILEKAWLAMSPLTASSTVYGNVILQSFSDQKPRDAIEARLVAQVAVLYSQGMNYLGKAEMTDYPEQKQQYVNMAVKLLRLHNETIEALQRYRRGGEQRVTVQHVHVSQGGQAIVGNVATRGGGHQNVA